MNIFCPTNINNPELNVIGDGDLQGKRAKPTRYSTFSPLKTQILESTDNFNELMSMNDVSNYDSDVM